jgi:hypothetical protein
MLETPPGLTSQVISFHIWPILREFFCKTANVIFIEAKYKSFHENLKVALTFLSYSALSSIK